MKDTKEEEDLVSGHIVFLLESHKEVFSALSFS